jgi:hypothetical protein
MQWHWAGASERFLPSGKLQGVRKACRLRRWRVEMQWLGGDFGLPVGRSSIAHLAAKKAGWKCFPCVGQRPVMRHKRLFCIATLVLIAATLAVIAADDFILPYAHHEPATCPICAVAQCLTTAQLPSPLIWVEPTTVHWLPCESVCISLMECVSRLFSARAPPILYS